MEKITLTKVFRTDKDKQGNPLKSSKGVPYTRLNVKSQEHGDKYISGFGNKENANWKEGDTVEVIIKQNGEYLNFEMPKATGDIGELTEKVKKLQSQVTSLDLSVERRVKELFAELKADLVLEMTGKFNLKKDLDEFNKSAEQALEDLETPF